MMKKLMIVTDAWAPQINGVVRTLEKTIEYLQKDYDLEVFVVHPYLWKTKPFWAYQFVDIPLDVNDDIELLFKKFNPDSLHIAVEGTLGRKAAAYCRKKNYSYTTGYHTQMAEYAKKYQGLPLWCGYLYLRWFHRHSFNVLAPTPSIVDHLHKKKLRNVKLWGRGVDTDLFHPRHRHSSGIQKPYALYVGRVSIEKNINAFLEAETPGLNKLVAGDGPQRAELERKYPGVSFVGFKSGEDLSAIYAGAEVFVFPSLTDTFGLVLLEALSCGTPVAAFPVAGPIDILMQKSASMLPADSKEVLHTPCGVLAWDLDKAIAQARKGSRENCRQWALNHYRWEKATQQFFNNLISL